MRINLTLEGAAGPTDVLLECDDATPAAEVAAGLRREAGNAGSVAVPDGSVADLGLVNGAHLAAETLLPIAAPPTSLGLQLHVVSGPGAGAVFDLPVGSHEAGRSGALSWNDHSLSRRHIRIDVTPEAVHVTDLGSSNGTLIDGTRCAPQSPTPWTPGQLLELGDSQALLRPARGSDATVEAGDPGWRNFMRPPRIQARHAAPTVNIPVAPGEQAKRRFPLIAMLIPLIFGVVMAVVMQRPQYLLFTLMSPVMMGANYFSDRQSGAKNHKQAMAEYAASLADAEKQLKAAIEAEQQRLREETLDAAELLLTAVLPGRRLWERRRHDPDFLHVRVGTADQPTTIKLTGATDAAEHQLRAVPVGFDLAAAGVAGLAGATAGTDGLLRWVIAQLAVHHSPRDLSMTFLTTPGAPEWSWVRWLPHMRGEDPEGAVAMVGNDTTSVEMQVKVLAEIVRERKEQLAANSGLRADSFPAHVVIVRGYRTLRSTLGLNAILENGPAVGVYAVCAEDSDRSLPETATAVVAFDHTNASHARLRQRGAADVGRLLADGVTVPWADRVARGISPLKDVGANEQGASLPDAARLLDVIHLDPPTADAVATRWIAEPRSTTMTIGAGMHGPFALDLRADGPHGLIAGTTGSGKSELLQTIIASLAVANRPDEMNFVLVDYKGGSAFKDCVKLPHTVGMVTDLDAHLVERALASLGAELKYREHQLASIGAKDIEDYQELRERDGGVPPLPRLMIVIDEFASMARELPNFITGLVSIAQRGRSLGIHLLLATQRPSGAVSPEIRANTNLRISLRVLDTGDSTDVLNAPDAARIAKSTPGRGFARLGHGALSPFQTGRVGGRRPGATSAAVPAPFVTPLGWETVGYAPPRPPQSSAAKVDADDTDLAALVEAVCQAADGIPAQRRPWLDALPQTLLLESIAPASADVRTLRPVVYGVKDIPSDQAQVPAAFDLDDFGHQFVVGGPKSGRTQFLRTVAASVARTTSPTDVHIYALDCGAGGLAPLTAMPHVGAVVGRNEPERATRLFARLAAETRRRQAVLGEGNFADIAEQRRSADPAQRLPHILFMVDRWEGFITGLGEVENGRYADAVIELMREGASLGIHLLITGDRTLTSYRFASLTENKLALRLPDKGDYSTVGVPPKKVPDEVPAGRGYEGDDAIETQIAVLTSDLDGAAQAVVLEQIAAKATHRDAQVPPERRPFRLDVIPTRISYDDAAAARPVAVSDRWVMVGVGGDELSALGADLGVGRACFVIAGPPRSGRSTALASLTRGLADSGARIILGTGRGGPMDVYASDPALLGTITTESSVDDVLALVSAADKGVPIALVLDDAEQFREAACKDLLATIARGDGGERFTFVIAGAEDALAQGLTGWIPEMRRAKRGLLLSAQDVTAGEIVGQRLPRSSVGNPIQPGRGLLVAGDGSAVTVQVPQAPATLTDASLSGRRSA